MDNNDCKIKPCISDEEIHETLEALRIAAQEIPEDLHTDASEECINEQDMLILAAEDMLEEARGKRERQNAEEAFEREKAAYERAVLRKKRFRTIEQNQKPKNSLFSQMVSFIVIPVFLLMVILTILISMAFSSRIYKEVKLEMQYSAVVLDEMLKELYPGEPTVVYVNEKDYVICLGEHVLNENDSQLLERMKEKTGMEYSYIYQNTRILTTIHGKNGERDAGSTVSHVVTDEVFAEGKEAFYDNAVINGNKYYAYYMPILDGNGNTVAMIGLAKPYESVMALREHVMLPIVLPVLAAFICVLIVATLYSRRITGVLRSVETFLNHVADGNLSARLNEDILCRKDELGKMARGIVSMRNSLRELIEKDALTTLPNRRYADKQMCMIRKKSISNAESFCVVIADIDFFKKVNDTYGHECGDMVLKAIAAILKKNMSKEGFAARWGGEEFLLVFESAEIPQVAEVLERIRREIEAHITSYQGKNVKVTMSFGLARADAEENISQTLKRADENLYEAKMNGRNRVVSDET